MCGRFAMDKESNDLLEEIVAEHGPGAINDWQKYWPPNFNVAPTNQVPVARARHGAREIASVRWGMVAPGAPAFAGKPVFNARIETVDKLGLFKQPFATSRCIVTAAGYYEWQLEDDGSKQPFFIRESREVVQPMSFAGVVRAWRDKEKAEDHPDAWRLSMAIITMDAHVTPGEVHDRMPAFLIPEVYDDWLGDHLGTAELKELLAHSSEAVAHNIEYYPVSKSVNKVEISRGVPNTGPELIAPIG